MSWEYPYCICGNAMYLMQYTFDTRTAIIECPKCKKKMLLDFCNKSVDEL